MSVSLRRGLLVVLTAFVPVGADACCLLNPFDTCGACGPRPWIGFTVGLPLPCFCGGCCGPCGPPPGPCGPPCLPPAPCGPQCLPPAPCGCGPGFVQPTPSFGVGPTLGPAIPSAYNCAFPPVCATLQPQSVTTYRNVPTIQYRREAYVENVPVTTYEQITVPRTAYQPQTRYRDVAYTVNQQVAQTHTAYVPQPAIGYAAPLPVITGCAPCNQSTAFGPAPQYASPSYVPAYTAAPYGSPAAGSVPTPIALPPATHQPSRAATLQEPQPYAESAWQTVPQRQAQDNTGIQQMGGFYPSYSPPPVNPVRSMFQPAPSAASVWQSRWMR